MNAWQQSCVYKKHRAEMKPQIIQLEGTTNPRLKSGKET